MCELFGLSSNHTVYINFTWRGFIRKGKSNPHGWGVAWFIGKGAALVKEPVSAHRSIMAKFLLERIKTHILISHVRYASCGSYKYVNTHPFIRELFGQEWVFAHNGTVSDIINDHEFKLKHYFPIGETDSEYAFCYIMDNLRDLGKNPNISEMFINLWSVANKIGSHGKFNFLLANQEYLFAFMNRSKTLYYLLRHPPHKGYARLIDEDFEVKLMDMKGPDEFAVLLATEPLTDENWIPFKRNTLYVFSSGDLLLKVDKNGISPALSKIEIDILRVIRKNPHSVKLKEISSLLGLDMNDVYEIVYTFLLKGYLRQHSRDRVPSYDPEARFYTNPTKRAFIDFIISSDCV